MRGCLTLLGVEGRCECLATTCYGFYTAGYTYIADISEENATGLNPSII